MAGVKLFGIKQSKVNFRINTIHTVFCLDCYQCENRNFTIKISDKCGFLNCGLDTLHQSEPKETNYITILMFTIAYMHQRIIQKALIKLRNSK